MAEQTDPRMQRAIDVIIRMQRAENPAAIEAFMPYIRKDAALLLEAIDGPAPDWADLREMARNAGYQLRRTTEGGGIRSDMRGCIRHTSHWEIEPNVVDHSIAQPVGSLDLIHWWWQAEGEEESGFVVQLDAEDRCGTEAHLESASPAQALTAARLVGLIGGTS